MCSISSPIPFIFSELVSKAFVVLSAFEHLQVDEYKVKKASLIHQTGLSGKDINTALMPLLQMNMLVRDSKNRLFPGSAYSTTNLFTFINRIDRAFHIGKFSLRFSDCETAYLIKLHDFNQYVFKMLRPLLESVNVVQFLVENGEKYNLENLDCNTCGLNIA